MGFDCSGVAAPKARLAVVRAPWERWLLRPLVWCPQRPAASARPVWNGPQVEGLEAWQLGAVEFRESTPHLPSHVAFAFPW